ncbi:hypothetical protein P171DRAFT_589 [Karstenula rhodostoma CBS 690.94]|uniref:Uncharacterized protein n=1 Tax=Karstenula rhodostoma CBS 690.94 TaxID=1392251 RepID=A0A9P4PVW5_9PLEO|nr:hypothetical protein P171DRAFT_589 [Karstenula rhodostoma CBS 690.94]
MQVFEDAGLFRPQWPILSYTWTPARSGDLSDTSLLRCSVAFCANQTVLGWWGVSVRKQPGDPGGNHSTNFIHIACDEMNLNPECRGLGEEGAGRWAATKDDYSQVPITVTATGTGTGEGRMESTTEATATSAVKSKGSERATSRSGAETSSASRSRR